MIKKSGRGVEVLSISGWLTLVFFGVLGMKTLFMGNDGTDEQIKDVKIKFLSFFYVDSYHVLYLVPTIDKKINIANHRVWKYDAQIKRQGPNFINPNTSENVHI